ncbi:MAG: NDP-sugar dehydrogenase [Candidatus Altiarchaeales archaeon ex4484_96]|nr:MAG: NDP-sugar dehydrogenase [Candidatus Altiarchaeales archaeon ex4484_96]
MSLYGLSTDEAAKALKDGLPVGVYGLGKMGLPLAGVFAESGARVFGADINPGVVDSINKGTNPVIGEPGLDELISRVSSEGKLSASTSLSEVASKAVLHVILVPTLVKDGVVDLSVVESVASELSKGLKKGDVVVTECTMPPGSTMSLISLLEGSGLKAGVDFGLAHCPERTMSGSALRDIKGEYPKVVGCLDDASSKAVYGIYSVINLRGVINVSDIRSAECVKVFEGVYRDVNIGLANELTFVCERLGVDSLEVFDVANSQPYCHIHRPGGVGGHCIPFYPFFVMDDETDLLRVARALNDSVALKLVDEAERLLGECSRSLDGARVLVLGLSFREGVKETIKSISLDLFAHLKQRGALVSCMDPLYTRDEVESFGVSYADSFKGFDCVLISTNHHEFRSLDWDTISKVLSYPVVVDGRQVVDPVKLKELGLLVYSLGYRI